MNERTIELMRKVWLLEMVAHKCMMEDRRGMYSIWDKKATELRAVMHMSSDLAAWYRYGTSPKGGSDGNN